METDIKKIHEKIQRESAFVQSLKNEISKVIVGQEDLIEKILVKILHLQALDPSLLMRKNLIGKKI